MAVLDTKTPPSATTGLDRHAVKVGPIGRLGRYTATHFRVVVVAWLVIAVVLGFFAHASRPPSPAPGGRPPARNQCKRDS